MPNDLEYIVKDALMMCDKGATPVSFSPTHNTHIKINGCLVTTKADKQPGANIPPFGACSIKNGNPCAFAPTDWTNTYKVKVKGQETLLYKSKMPCATGGKIEFITSGQVKLPPEEYDKLMEEHGQEEDEGWGWWDTLELIPVIGNVIGMVREAKKGNWGMVGLNAGFLILDVVTLGTSSLATAGVKGGIKAGAKAIAKGAAKTTTKAGAKALAKGAGKAFAKGAAKAVDDLAIKLGKVCVFACFTAGTKVAVKDGHKNIEEVRVGDLVWAYNEKTGESNLKPVLHTMQKEVDTTIELTLGKEVIETTAEHPFYTKTGWKDAADLKLDDSIKTKKGHWQRVEATNFMYQKKKVYNFEVAELHTYFVGVWEWLVHNAQPCFKTMARESQKWFQNIMRGRSFNMVMNNFTRELAELSGKNFADEVYVKLAKGGTKSGKGYVDSFIEGVGIIERKATNLAEVTVQTAKNYVNDAAKYIGSHSDEMGELGNKVFLQVENMKGVSQEVLDHASKKGVEIIDDITTILK